MTVAANCAGPIALALLFGLGQTGCNTRTPGADNAAGAPADSGVQTASVNIPADTSADTAVATPSITPPPASARDTPPAAAKPAQPTDQGKGDGFKVSRLEYEGWRQYSVNCARCHGQDVLPNPVAANLLISLGPKGPIKSYEEFAEIVTAGRPASGMPAFKGVLTPEQIRAIYAYVKGRAEGRIPPGRPDRPEA
jgi:mono/diheme cytochrome c family protein